MEGGGGDGGAEGGGGDGEAEGGGGDGEAEGGGGDGGAEGGGGEGEAEGGEAGGEGGGHASQPHEYFHALVCATKLACMSALLQSLREVANSNMEAMSRAADTSHELMSGLHVLLPVVYRQKKTERVCADSPRRALDACCGRGSRTLMVVLCCIENFR